MKEELYYGDEIDLRELVLTIWQGRWVIITLTLIVSLAAFAFNKWVLPEKYEAIAYVSITEPMLQFKDTSEISISAKLPDIASATELATNQALLEKVTAAPEIVPLWDAASDSITEIVEVAAAGKDQLRLIVSDTNPERAALLANIWAEQVAKQINLLYGVEAIAQTLEAQVAQSKEEYALAQGNLENELLQNKLDALNAQLERTKGDLSCVLSRNSAATRILEDLRILEESLQNQTGGGSLSLGDALSLTTLQQRASASQICASQTQNPQLQIENETLIGIPLSDALEAISQMQEALQTQQPLVVGEQARLEAEIPSLQRDLAKAEYQLDQRVQVRNQSQELYTALLQQQSRITAILRTSGKVATISAFAVVPDEKSSPKTLINIALAGVLGLMLSVFWVFVAGWWQKSAEEERA
jgi:polysaccharide biosynthesis transport protein